MILTAKEIICIKENSQALLSPIEQEALSLSKDPQAFLAKRLAAKQALKKCLQLAKIDCGDFSKITIDHDRHGKPFFVLPSVFNKNITEVFLSISDQEAYAFAYVLIELIGGDHGNFKRMAT